MSRLPSRSRRTASRSRSSCYATPTTNHGLLRPEKLNSATATPNLRSCECPRPMGTEQRRRAERGVGVAVRQTWTDKQPTSVMDVRPCTTNTEWQAQLAGQTRRTVTPDQALAAVRAAWATAVNEDWP